MYQGTFVNTSTEEVSDLPGVVMNTATNERGESYYDLRNNPNRPEYVVLVHPKTGYVLGCAREGGFTFPYPIKVYFMSSVPDDSIDNPGQYRWDDDHGFRKLIDVESWRYNQEAEARDELLLAVLKDDKSIVTTIKGWIKTTRGYEGNGYEPPLPIKPYDGGVEDVVF